MDQSSQSQIKVSLEESQLWEKFAVLTNEMIVTKVIYLKSIDNCTGAALKEVRLLWQQVLEFRYFEKARKIWLVFHFLFDIN